jgi:hypothetical protein
VYLTRAVTARRARSDPPRIEQEAPAPIGEDEVVLSAHERLVWPRLPDSSQNSLIPSVRFASAGGPAEPDDQGTLRGPTRAAILMLEFIFLACGLSMLVLLR